jgi:hypothetical protein
MADNSSIPVASGNETFANKDIAGVKYPRHITVDSTGADVSVATGPKQDTGNASLAAIEAAIEGALTVADPYDKRKAAPANATTTMNVDGVGAIGDYLAGVLIIPLTLSPGSVSLKDGAGAAEEIFVGGANSITTLWPKPIPWGVTSTTGAWQIVCGANVKAIGIGKF